MSRLRPRAARVVLVLALWLGPPTLAHGPLHVVASRAAGRGVKLDGDVAAWDAKRFVAVTHKRASFGAAASDADASFRFALLWDATSLYVAVEVKDNSIVPAPTLARLYEGDCVELGFDVGNDSEGAYEGTDYQFVICPTGPDKKPRLMLYRNPFLTIADMPTIRCTANITTEGYVLEMAFPWKELGTTPKPGAVLGFQIDVRDHDADGSQKGLTWAPASDPTANPLRWGDLVLVAKATDDVTPVLDGLKATNARWQRLLAGKARETDNEVTVDVRWATVGDLALGLGWNVQFRDGRFPRWDEGAWASFLELLAWTQPGWIRYGVNLGHWEPRNDDGDPSHPNWSSFAFRSRAMRHHYRVLDACMKNDIRVLWANWRIGDRASGAKWLAESVHRRDVVDTDGDPFNDAPYDPEELAESLAACIYHLKRVRRYTCVRQVSLWNEPSEGWSFNSPSAKYPGPFWAYYNALARHLRNLGVRADVQILGPETSTSSYASLPWLPKYLELHSKEVDVLAHHDYLGYADYHRIDKGAPLGGARAAYLKLRKQTRRPIAVTELGNMGAGAGEVAGEADCWAGSLSLARLILDGLNLGVAGFLRWEFKPYGVSGQSYGALTTLTKKHLFAPYRPVFFPHALLCRAARRGSTILHTTLAGGRDENAVARVAAATLYKRDAGLAFLLVNDGFQPKSVVIRFEKDFPEAVAMAFGHLSYDAALPAGFRKHPDAVAAEKQLKLTLGPRSIHALVNRPNFAAVPSLPFLPPRDEPVYTAVAAGNVVRHAATMQFNGDYHWRVWQSTAGHTTFTIQPERGNEANRVLRIAYDFVGIPRGARTEHVVAHTDLLVDGVPKRVSFRLRGDGQAHRIRFLFLDARGEVFEHPAATRIRWQGWQQVARDIELPLTDWNHWSGDGKVDYPLRAFGLTLLAATNAYKGRGLLELDDIQILSEAPATPRTGN